MKEEKNYTPNWDETLSQTYFDLRVRNDLLWDFSEVPVEFVDGDPIESIFWAAFSCASRPLEGFFIRVLRPYLTNNVHGDEKLIRDIDGMIEQEAQHSRSHHVFNQHLETLGYPMSEVEQFYKKKIEGMLAGYDEKDMLGLISGGEHGLYSLAREFLYNKHIRKTMHPEAYKLFYYHFLEEAEHSAVSHDMYKAVVGNNYLHRVKTALRAAMHLIPMFMQGCRMLYQSIYKQEMTQEHKLQLYKIFFVNPGMVSRLTVRLTPYIMPWHDLSQNMEGMAEIQRMHEDLYRMDERTRRLQASA